MREAEQKKKEKAEAASRNKYRKGAGAGSGTAAVSPGTRFVSCYEKTYAVYNPLFLGKSPEQPTRSATIATGLAISPEIVGRLRSKE